jgi:REP element-mobilizing transposase RayT
MFQKIENLWFFTATINSWQKIIDNKNAKIILDSLNYMVSKNWIKVYGFVVMPNHIHLILSLHNKDKIAFQRDFLKYTTQLIIENLKSSII